MVAGGDAGTEGLVPFVQEFESKIARAVHRLQRHSAGMFHQESIQTPANCG